MPSPDVPQLSLARAVYSFVLIGVFAVGLGISMFASTYSSRLVDAALDTAVRVRAQSASDGLARMLHGDWADLKFLASAVAESDPARIGGLMDGMRGDGTRISWIGFAGDDGIVRQASGGLLIGQDVSQRPWFRNGLEGSFAGDVHEAVLLAKLVDTGEDVPRFIDLALPVRNASGEATGVVGVHINFAWTVRTLTEMADQLKLDLFLLNANGGIVMATAAADPTPVELQILRAAGSGVAAQGREVWPDGRDYFSSLVPSITYDDLPNFGWRLVGRLDGEAFRPDIAGVQGAAIWSAIGIFSILVILTAAFVLFFVRPIETLAEHAHRIADGEDVYPPEQRRTREIALLSGAIARLQSLVPVNQAGS